MTDNIEHIVFDDGRQEWRLNGLLHRVDGPARIYPDGSQGWYINGVYHRVDGPVYIGADGYQAWYQNGKLHRLDGPARIWPDGHQEWYVNGIDVAARIKELIDNGSINSDYNQWENVEKVLVQLAIR